MIAFPRKTARRPALDRAPQRTTGSHGSALVITLFALVIVSVVIVAYLVQSTLNRKISFSSAGQARANMLALSALNIVKGDFINEIAAGSALQPDTSGNGGAATGTSGVPIYYPNFNNNMVPYRMTAQVASNPAIPSNLIKWSSGTYSLWVSSGSAKPGPFYSPQTQGPIRAYPGNSTKNSSNNGHYIDVSRWAEPNFSTTTGTFPATVVPEWVLMTRQGPLPSGTSALSMLTSGSLANPTANNVNYVIGRYAYTVYDEGGLLDVTAAGYPNVMTPPGDPNDVPPKGNQGYADLTQLGLSTGQINQLVTWRNAATSASGTSYVSYLSGTAAQTGFLQAATGDHAFVSRQDFLQFWNSQIVPSGSTASTLTPYFTTFSRETNAPSWGPEHDANDPTYVLSGSMLWSGSNTTVNPVTPSGTLSYAYHDNQNVAGTFNRFFPDVRVVTSFARLSMSGTAHEQATVGEPLVKNRFDLTKLGWITHSGTFPTGVAASDVYNYFGLIYTGSNSWVYDHTSTTYPGAVPASPTSTIMTLDQVATAGREPDFFELLQATILRGSLGLCSGDPTQATNNTASGDGGEFYRLALGAGASFQYVAPFCRSDTNGSPTNLSLVYAMEKYQVIQIGANLIDQYDSDNFPTDIALNGEHFYGIENLPYINAIADTAFRPAPSAVTSTMDSGFAAETQYQAYVHRWMNFALWNPHQNATTPPANGPTTFRICVTQGNEYPSVTHLGLGTKPTVDYSGRIFEVPNTAIASSIYGTNTDGPAWIEFNSSDYNNFPEPALLNYQHSVTSDPNGGPNINDPDGRISTSLGWNRAGIYMGWSKSPDNPYKTPLSAPLFPSYQTSNNPAIGNDLPQMATSIPFIVLLQYEEPSSQGTWHTYQVFRGVSYARGSGSGDAYMEPSDPAWAGWSAVPQPPAYTTGENVTTLVTGAGPLSSGSMDYWVNNLFDPRTARSNVQVIHAPASATGQAAISFATITQVLPGAEVGPHFPDAGITKDSRDAPQNWINNQTTTVSYYTDRDYVRRVGDAAGWAGASPLPVGSGTLRPWHLDRPFRSVAEIGYVFRDDPWKTLNLISANSGDTGLMDLFYMGSNSTTTPTLPAPDVVAGKMNINSAAGNAIASSGTSPVLQALISQAVRTYTATGTSANVNTAITSPGDIQALAASIGTFVTANGALMNLGDLPAVFPQDTSVTTQNPGVKQQREALIRSLADSSGTRTWNLMIDVIAQSGKFSTNANTLDKFTVEGEKHYWLHVAIDRFTGQIIDQQLEPVTE